VDPARVQRGDVLALIEPLLASDEDNVADEIEDDDAFGDVNLFKSGGTMPLVTVFNLRREDRLSDLEEATRRALTSMPELAINDNEIDLVPILSPDDFDGEVTRINVDLCVADADTWTRNCLTRRPPRRAERTTLLGPPRG
jgi:hypothetical protein